MQLDMILEIDLQRLRRCTSCATAGYDDGPRMRRDPINKAQAFV